MQILLLFTTLLVINGYNLASGDGDINDWSIRADLESLNFTCPFVASCANGRTTDSLAQFACQCTSVCAKLNTCCFDSSYRSVKPSKISSSCRSISNSERYFMVDRCPPNSVWESLCKEEWNGDSDVLKIVPVTSLFTLMTYKNYFCFRCHETTDNYLYWNVELESTPGYEFDPSIDSSGVSVTYVQRYRTWAAPVGIEGAMIPVVLNVRIPTEILPLPERCEQGVISHCAATWEDRDVIDKCEAYMGIVIMMQNDTVLAYRNAHCAMCNYEDFSNIYCKSSGSGSGSGGKVPFSFTHLLDVNRSDGDKVGKVQKCEDDSLFDPYAKKCRELKCALPGYVVKAGNCTPP